MKGQEIFSQHSRLVNLEKNIYKNIYLDVLCVNTKARWRTIQDDISGTFTFTTPTMFNVRYATKTLQDTQTTENT